MSESAANCLRGGNSTARRSPKQSPRDWTTVGSVAVIEYPAKHKNSSDITGRKPGAS